MYDLPIFPLRVVLFPGMEVRLRVFEPRYRRMIWRCARQRRTFGIALIHHGLEARGPLPAPYTTGTEASILALETQAGGDILIDVRGEERFRILGFKPGEPFLVGDVEPLLLHWQPGFDAQTAARQLTPWVQAYLDLLLQLPNPNYLWPGNLRAPRDPQDLLYLAAKILVIADAEKQRLLELNTARELATELFRLYRRELCVEKSTRLVPQAVARKAGEKN
jgi:Lon protease-like protein